MKPEPIALFGSRVHARGEGGRPTRFVPCPQALEETSMAESTSQLNQLYQQAQESERAAAQRRQAGTYAKVAGILSTIDAELREHVQRSTVESVRKIIDRLKSGADLSDEDMKLVELWVVGDALAYQDAENDVQGWQADIQRILGEMQILAEKRVTPWEASRVRGLVRDAIRSAWDLDYYFEHQQRLDSFKATTEQLDESERKFLARLLEKKLESSEM